MQHLDEGILQAWLDRPRSGLDPSESAEIERHLASCERCAAALEDLRGGDERTRSLLAMGVDRDMPRPPFEEVVRRARGGESAGGARLRLNRMAWAASIVVALGVGWMTNEMVRTGAVPVSESVQPASRDEAAPLPAEAPAAEPPAAVADADLAARARQSEPAVSAGADGQAVGAQADAFADAADASGGGADDRAGGAAALTPERTAELSGRADAAPEPAAPSAADAPAAAERREVDDAPSAADLADEEIAVVRGVVRTSDGAPLSSAQVYVDDLDVGTLSGSDGSYTLMLPRNELDSARVDVVVTRIGFREESRRVSVEGAEPVVADFGLQEQVLELQEVVVTGTAGGVQRRAVGNAIARVEAVPTEWSPATLEEAGSRVGRTLVTSPGLDVVAVEITADGVGEGPLARVLQDLGDGAVLTLVQGVAPPEREAWPIAPGGAVESTRVGELLVTATAPVSDTLLRALLAGLR